jgi:hypothetical protein
MAQEIEGKIRSALIVSPDAKHSSPEEEVLLEEEVI